MEKSPVDQICPSKTDLKMVSNWKVSLFPDHISFIQLLCITIAMATCHTLGEVSTEGGQQLLLHPWNIPNDTSDSED